MGGMAPAPWPLRRIEALVFLTVFLDLVGFGIVIPLLPFYVQSMGGSELTVGVLLGSFSFTQLLATPLLGRFSDRYGRRPIILLSLAANAIAMGLFSLASYHHLLPLLFASRILAGATSGNLSACQAVLADVTPSENRARAMGRLGAGIGLGLVLGPMIGGQLSLWGAWFPPLAAGALALLGALGVLVAMPETHLSRSTAAKQPSRLSVFHSSPRQRALRIMLLLYFFVFLSMTTLQVAFALLAQERLGWGAKQVGYVFALVGGLGLVIQGGLIGPLSKAVGEARLLILGTLILCAGMLGVSVAAQPLSLIGAVILLGTGLGLIQPLLGSLASQAANPSLLGLTLGLAQSSGGLARTVGPVASGALYKSLGASAPFTAGALIALGATVLGALLKREGLGKRRDS
ncbi:major facilitator superfamily MFS_1 [Archangium gephyra]|uniref:Major facilitator superfamily MFS_1 n=2 Tax=Archangium gephyra TaxID=48 RepID=A0AAC8TES1_9BACT|nr:major facilitator superfamily MFS_1 [Archangium gephyra]